MRRWIYRLIVSVAFAGLVSIAVMLFLPAASALPAGRLPALFFLTAAMVLGSVRACEKPGPDLPATGATPAPANAALLLAEERHRMQTENALRESEELYRMLVETSPDVIMLAAPDGTIQVCNQRALSVGGYRTAGDLIGRNAFDLVIEEDRDRFRQTLLRLLDERKVVTLEQTMVRNDGSRYPAELNVSVFTDSNGNSKGFIAILRDLTERRRLENQLVQAQKMESVGKLAGGVAHDFNNLLTAIIGYSDLILGDPGVTETMRQDLLAIKKATEKATGLVRQLLAFSRKQLLQPRVLNLNSVVAELNKMLHRFLGENIELITDLDADLGFTRADPMQMEQVLLNLAINARESMPEGGKFTIETRNMELREFLSHPGIQVPPGSYVTISLSDSGPGMDEKTSAHLFDPFSSTGKTGQGTGLGLSTVYGIVQQSGGYILIRSEPGQGTAFQICMPRVPAPEERDAVAAAGARGNETILLAEDEDGVRNVIRTSLEARGYKVLVARNGVEAAEIFRAHSEKIRILLTDLVMPRTGGLELVRQLRSSQPELKVLFISGYSDRPPASQQINQPGTHFMQKPFTTERLARAIRGLLDEHAA